MDDNCAVPGEFYMEPNSTPIRSEVAQEVVNWIPPQTSEAVVLLETWNLLRLSDVTKQASYALMMQSVQKCSVGLGGFVLPHDSDSRFFIERGTQDCLTFVGTRGAVCTGVTSDLCRRLHPTVIPRRTRNCVNGFGSRQVCRASHEEEFKSSRSIALGLHRRYKDVVDGGFANLKEFVDAGVTAYAIGCTDEGMRKELLSVCELDCESVVSPGSSVQLKTRVTAEEVEDCILWLCIVFLTIICSPPPTVVRWSSSPAVSAEREMKWRGFCALIANAYYTRGMAWMPIKTLQLEQLAVVGRAEEPAVVADRMRLVFATLEIVSPQWPKR